MDLRSVVSSPAGRGFRLVIKGFSVVRSVRRGRHNKSVSVLPGQGENSVEGGLASSPQ